MMQESETLPQNDGRTKWVRWALGAFALLVIGVWFFTPAGGLDRRVELRRDEDGKLQDVAEDGSDDGVQIAAHLGALQASNNRMRVSSSSGSEPSWFAARSLVIINRSDHLLMKRVAAALLKEFKDGALFDEIDYYPHGESPAVGALAPDLVMTLDLVSIKESGLIGRDLEAEVLSSLGTSYSASNHSASSSTDPPYLEVRSQTVIEHTSSLTGVESSGAKYGLQGQDIATQLTKQLTDDLKNLREDHAPPLPLPKAALSEYHEPPAFDFLKDLAAEQVWSVHGIMVHNETFWELPEPSDIEAALRTIAEELQAAGWKGNTDKFDAKAPHLRMRDDVRALEVFREGQGTTISSLDKDGARPRRLLIRYVDRATEDEVRTWYQSLLDDPRPNVSLLLDLWRYGDKTQREQVLRLVEASPPRTVQAWLKLAEHYRSQKETETAVTALRRAYAISQLHTQDKHKSKIDQLAKKLEIDKKSLRDIDLTTWQECGVPQLSPEVSEGTVDFSVGEAAAFVVPGEGEWSIRGVELKTISEGSIELTSFENDSRGMRSWSTLSPVDLPRTDRRRLDNDRGTLVLTIEDAGDGRFRLTGTLETPTRQGD